MWKLLIASLLISQQTLAKNNLNVKFKWNQLDFQFPSEDIRKAKLQNEDFIPENNLPLGLEIYEDRLFITVPRWKKGVASSLNFIDITDSDSSPKLRAYPNWDAHDIKAETPEIVSPFRIKSDECGRLWVLDTGIADILGDTKILAHPRITVYDLKTDKLLRQYTISKEYLKEDSFLGNIVVEVVNCEDTYAYIADLGKSALIVYSWKNNSSSRINHNYFNVDPLAGEFNVEGINFTWTDAIFGVALSPVNSRGYSTLYFHPLNSFNEFSVSTEFLRDPEIAKKSYHKFNILGTRGRKGQSTASFYHPKTGILFYGLVNLNAVDCWRTNEAYNLNTQGRVYQNNVTMIFPNDVKVDSNDNLWVLSDRLPRFMYEKLDPLDVNFRILTAPVSEAIKETVCEGNNPQVMNRFNPNLRNEPQETTSKRTDDKSAAFIPQTTSILMLLTLILLRNM